MGRAEFFSGGSLCLPASRGYLLWVMTLPLHPQRQQPWMSPSVIPSFRLLPLHLCLSLPFPPTSTFKDHCYYFTQENLTILISNLESICSLNSSLTCNITYSQAPGFRTGSSFGDHCSSYYRYIWHIVTKKKKIKYSNSYYYMA